MIISSIERAIERQDVVGMNHCIRFLTAAIGDPWLRPAFLEWARDLLVILQVEKEWVLREQALRHIEH